MGRIAALVPEFSMKDLPLGRTLMMMIQKGAKGNWDFPISYLIRNPDGTDILIPVVNFGEVRRAKSTLLTSTWVPLGTLQIF